MATTVPVLTDLTESTLDGEGVFDKLMLAASVHMTDQFTKNRLKGPEYATVYLGALQSSMDQAIRFLLDKNNAALIEAQIALAEKQILLADKDLVLKDREIDLKDKAIDLAGKELLIKDKELELLEAQLPKLEAETALLEAKALNEPKQGLLIDAQTALAIQDRLNKISEELLVAAQKLKTDQDTANGVIQGTLLSAQKLLTDSQELKTDAEAALLTQKKLTEAAQITATAAPGSVIGEQVALYQAQAVGYENDMRIKAAKVKADWVNVLRSTNPEFLFGPLEIDRWLDDLEITGGVPPGLQPEYDENP